MRIYRLFGIFGLILFLLVHAAAFAQTQIKVLTLNTWMLKLPIGYEVAELVEERARILPDLVAQTGADIVGLQEMWPKEVREQVSRDLQLLGYTYVAENDPRGAFRGMMGNGLILFSKYPLDPQVDVLTFSDYTRADEFFCYKGAIHTRVEIPEVSWVDLYDAHLGAITFDTTLNEYDEKQEDVKTGQARELVNFMRSTAKESTWLMTSDLNSHYLNFKNGVFTHDLSPVYVLMTDVHSGLGLMDTFHKLNGLPGNDCTYCMENVYAKEGLFGNAPSEVEDYIFVNSNSTIVPVESHLVFKEELDPAKTKAVHISDHYGLLTTFEIRNL